MKLGPISCLLLLWFVACAPSQRFVQIHDLASQDTRTIEKHHVVETDTIQLAYYFWAEGGLLGMVVHNKSNGPIYIDWKKSSFIAGNQKIDYLSEGATVYSQTRRSSTTTPALLQTNTWITETFGSSVTTVVPTERITFIPPRSSMFRVGFVIQPVPTLSVGVPMKITDSTIYTEQLRSGSKMVVPVSVRLRMASFVLSNSPLVFRSFVTFASDEKFSVERYLDTRFYLARIVEIPSDVLSGHTTLPDGRSYWDLWYSPSAYYHESKNQIQSSPNRLPKRR